jgi:multiple sugar transport system substrate-binding protein
VSAYRPDLIARPPQTWDEVLQLAREGLVLWPYKPIDAFSSLITLAANGGEPAMAQPGLFLSHDTALATLDFMRELAAHVPGENAGWNPIQAADALSTGDRWAYCPLLFGYSNYSRMGFRPNRLAFVDIPGVTGSLLGGAGIAVSASSDHVDEAVDHAFWLASAEVQEGVYYDGGGQPGNAAAWESERTNTDSLDFFRGTRATLEAAYLRPRHHRYIELQDALSPLVTEALAGRISDNEAIDRLNAGAAEYLGGI